MTVKIKILLETHANRTYQLFAPGQLKKVHLNISKARSTNVQKYYPVEYVTT